MFAANNFVQKFVISEGPGFLISYCRGFVTTNVCINLVVTNKANALLTRDSDIQN